MKPKTSGNAALDLPASDNDPLAVKDYRLSLSGVAAYIVPFVGVVFFNCSLALFFVSFFIEMLFYVLGLLVFQTR